MFTAKPTRIHLVQIVVLAFLVLSHSLSSRPVAHAATVVGNGTPESCTEAALEDALRSGGTITFNCGPSPVTIDLSDFEDFDGEDVTLNATIDGNHLVTLTDVRYISLGGDEQLTLYRLKLTDVFIDNRATLNLIDSEVSHSDGDIYGVIANYTGILNVTGSTFSENQGRGSGVIANEGGRVTIQNSTFSNNKGPAIINRSYGSTGILTIHQSTFEGSTTDDQSSSAIVENNGTIPVVLQNTLIVSHDGSPPCDFAIPVADSSTNNLQWPGTSCGSSITSADPKLGTLANNGGPTQTVALLEGSPAIDAGNAAVCAADPINNRDQRGRVRPQGAACDIGAFEFGSDSVSYPVYLPFIIR